MTCTAPGMNRHTQCSVFLIKNANNSSFTAFTRQLGCLWLYPQAVGVLIKRRRMDINFHNVSSQGGTYWQQDSTTKLDRMTSGSKLAFPERNCGACFCVMMTSLQCNVAWKNSMQVCERIPYLNLLHATFPSKVCQIVMWWNFSVWALTFALVYRFWPNDKFASWDNSILFGSVHMGNARSGKIYSKIFKRP